MHKLLFVSELKKQKEKKTTEFKLPFFLVWFSGHKLIV